MKYTQVKKVKASDANNNYNYNTKLNAFKSDVMKCNKSQARLKLEHNLDKYIYFPNDRLTMPQYQILIVKNNLLKIKNNECHFC